jgi:hypothetical protein
LEESTSVLRRLILLAFEGSHRFMMKYACQAWARGRLFELSGIPDSPCELFTLIQIAFLTYLSLHL